MALQAEGKLINEILDNLSDGVYFVDTERRIEYWNRGAERITGFKAEEVAGRSCFDNVLNHVDQSGCKLCTDHCPLAKAIETGQHSENEVFLHHKDGHRIPVQVRIQPIVNEVGEITGAVEVFSDASHYMNAIERIHQLECVAFLDELTGLPNRHYIKRTLSERFDEYRRYGWGFGVALFDIDHFKLFNDSFGHEAGDEVLKRVAFTFMQSNRPFDLFGRWGGEEFLAIVPNVKRDDLQRIVERNRILVEASSLRFDDRELKITVSAGATMINDRDTQASVIARADELLYQSKDGGRNRVTVD